LQGAHDDLEEEKFLEEKAALEAKYLEFCGPLYEAGKLDLATSDWSGLELFCTVSKTSILKPYGAVQAGKTGLGNLN